MILYCTLLLAIIQHVQITDKHYLVLSPCRYVVRDSCMLCVVGDPSLSGGRNCLSCFEQNRHVFVF